MLKKIITVVIILSLLISISGCFGTRVTSHSVTDNDAPGQTTATAGNDNDSTPTTSKTATTTTEERIFSVGDRVVVDDEYALTIVNVYETEDRNDFSDQEVEQVVIIDYLYENLAKDENLYISEFDFKAVDEDGNMTDTYPVSGLYNPENAPTGAKCLASMVLGITSKSSSLKLLFYGNMFDSKETAEFDITIGNSVDVNFAGELPQYENMYSVGDIIQVQTADGEYTISINSVKKTTNRNQFADIDPASVYIIDYTYSNVNMEEPLYISELNFRIIDSHGFMAFTYPADTNKYPQDVIEGAKSTAEMAYGTLTEGDQLILCYSDNMFSDLADLYILVP